MPWWWNGRHAGFKNQCRKAWGFESPSGYMKSKLFFTERALPIILEAFGMFVDKEGFVLIPDGRKVESKKIIGISKEKGVILEDDK